MLVFPAFFEQSAKAACPGKIRANSPFPREYIVAAGVVFLLKCWHSAKTSPPTLKASLGQSRERMANIKCTKCGAILKTQAPVAPGKKVKCPKCQEVFVVQAEEEEKKPAPEPEEEEEKEEKEEAAESDGEEEEETPKKNAKSDDDEDGEDEDEDEDAPKKAGKGGGKSGGKDGDGKPKKKSNTMMIVLIAVGALFLCCCLPSCGTTIWKWAEIMAVFKK
jgi:phage FluMu protein Com